MTSTVVLENGMHQQVREWFVQGMHALADA